MLKNILNYNKENKTTKKFHRKSCNRNSKIPFFNFFLFYHIPIKTIEANAQATKFH